MQIMQHSWNPFHPQPFPSPASLPHSLASLASLTYLPCLLDFPTHLPHPFTLFACGYHSPALTAPPPHLLPSSKQWCLTTKAGGGSTSSLTCLATYPASWQQRLAEVMGEGNQMALWVPFQGLYPR